MWDMLLSMAHETFFGTAVFVACLRDGSIIVKIIAALIFLAFFASSILSMGVFKFVGKP
jgi:hypothetical protein